MPINKYGTEYIIEIQNKEQSEGIFCVERIIAKVHDEGAGPFLSLKTENLEPTEEWDNYTVTLEQDDIQNLADKLKEILSGDIQCQR